MLSLSLDIQYFDFLRAFGKIPQLFNIQGKKKKLEVDSNEQNRIRNYPNNIKQRVIVNETASRWSPFTSGVPRGSAPGPVLFLLFINEIHIGFNIIMKNSKTIRKAESQSGFFLSCVTLGRTQSVKKK